MLSQLEIHGHQSLRSAVIPLGRFTAVTGPSNSGKSSIVRALLALVSNMRGTDPISTGKSTCTIAAVAADEGWGVRLTRTRSHRGDEYRTAPDGEVFTKLAGGVPDAVTALLRTGPLNVAGQHEPPFLLTESGREVAQALGDLTNVSMVLRAAAEAGRIRKGLARDLKGAETRLAGLAGQAQSFAGLGDRLAAIAEAEQAAAVLEGKAARLDRLMQLESSRQAGQDVADQLGALALEAEPPSLDRLAALSAGLGRLRQLCADTRDLAADVAAWDTTAAAEAASEEALHGQLHQVLAEAGTCPTCGQTVTRPPIARLSKGG